MNDSTRIPRFGYKEKEIVFFGSEFCRMYRCPFSLDGLNLSITQNFVRNYNYDNPADNRLSSFTVDSNSFANTYDNCGLPADRHVKLTKEGSLQRKMQHFT